MNNKKQTWGEVMKSIKLEDYLKHLKTMDWGLEQYGHLLSDKEQVAVYKQMFKKLKDFKK